MNKIDSRLKSLIESFPGSKVRPLAVALHYMSEDCEKEGDFVVGYLKMLEFVIENGLRLVEEEAYVAGLLEDGAAAGAAGGDGGVANSVSGIQPTDEPVIEPATKKNKKKMDTVAAYASLFTS